MRKKTKNRILLFSILLGLGFGLTDYGTSGNLILAAGTTLLTSTMCFGISYLSYNLIGSIREIDKNDQIQKNTVRIYELEKEVGIRDE